MYVNTSYLDSTQYCSNDVTDSPIARSVQFHYAKYRDLNTHSIAGAFITWSNLLSSISIGINLSDEITVNRTYSLTYGQSATTNDSFISQVMENAEKTIRLLTFSLPRLGPAPGDLLTAVLLNPFQAESSVVTLRPLNNTDKVLTILLVWYGTLERPGSRHQILFSNIWSVDRLFDKLETEGEQGRVGVGDPAHQRRQGKHHHQLFFRTPARLY